MQSDDENNMAKDWPSILGWSAALAIGAWLACGGLRRPIDESLYLLGTFAFMASVFSLSMYYGFAITLFCMGPVLVAGNYWAVGGMLVIGILLFISNDEIKPKLSKAARSFNIASAVVVFLILAFMVLSMVLSSFVPTTDEPFYDGRGGRYGGLSADLAESKKG